MNKRLHLTLGFVTGVAVGASVMSLYLNRKHGEKLDILQEEWSKPVADYKEFVEVSVYDDTQEEFVKLQETIDSTREDFVKIVSDNYVSDEENTINTDMVKSPVRDASKEINNKHTPVDYTTFVETRVVVDDIAKELLSMPIQDDESLKAAKDQLSMLKQEVEERRLRMSIQDDGSLKVAKGQLSMSLQDDGSFVFKEHGKEDAEVIDIYDEEEQNPKIVGKSGIEVIHDEEMYGDDDYAYYEKLTLMYYDDDHTLTDDSDIPISNIHKLVGDNLDLFEHQDVIYLRNHDLETDFEVVRVENSYSESVLGITP